MCPLLNKSRPSCMRRLRLDELTFVFDRCAGRYAECDIYRKLMLDARPPDSAQADARRSAS